MSGIFYVSNPQGEKTAVLIDLRRHARLWEDFHDGMVADSRKLEPRESLAAVRKRLSLKRRSAHA